jgi:MFS family permease
MIQTEYTQLTQHTTSSAPGLPTVQNDVTFYPDRRAYQRNRLLAALLIAISLVGAAILGATALLFWPTYTHPFTPYLKWQDALLAILTYSSFLLLLASIIILRFHLALRRSQRQGIFTLHPHGILTLRDLSPKNFAGIYRIIGASFTCFLAALLGLAPCILIGWTLHLTHPILIIGATAIAILISLLGLTLTILSTTFLLISLVGAHSFTRTLGAPHTYPLTKQITLRIDNLVLTITYPDRPETLFDLNLLHPHDQRHLLQLLQQHSLGQHIEAAIQDSLNRPPVSA